MKKDLLSEVFGSERTDSWSTPRVPLPRVPREKTGGGCYIFHGLSFKHSDPQIDEWHGVQYMFKWGSTFLSGGLSSQNPRHSSSAFCPKSTTPPLHRAPCGQLPNHQFDKVNMLPSEPAFSDPIYRDLQSTLYIPKKETAPLLNQPPSLFPGHLKPPLPEAGFGPEKADIPPAGPEDLPNRSVQPDTGETPAVILAVSPSFAVSLGLRGVCTKERAILPSLSASISVCLLTEASREGEPGVKRPGDRGFLGGGAW